MLDPDTMVRMWLSGDRWWSWGRYERECAAFDAEHPLSREVWESVQRHRREDFLQMAMQPFPFDAPVFERTESDIEMRIRTSMSPVIAKPLWPGLGWLP